MIEVLDRLEAAADFWARGTPPCWVCGNFQYGDRVSTPVSQGYDGRRPAIDRIYTPPAALRRCLSQPDRGGRIAPDSVTALARIP